MIRLARPSPAFFLSDKDFDNRVLYPRVPDNFFTRNGFEDCTAERVSFSTSIEGGLRGLSYNLAGKEFFVHTPVGNYTLYRPDTREVPDSEITGELWVCSPVKVKKIGRIRVTDDTGEDGITFSYGSNTAELYDWNYYWTSLDTTVINRQTAIRNLNDTLNDFAYGIVLDGKAITDSRQIDLNFGRYRTLSPREFLKFETGVCWDYADFEAYYFSDILGMRLVCDDWLRFGDTFSLYYMEFEDNDGDRPTHTWLAYRLGDRIYAFESSWKPYAGIAAFPDEEAMIEEYIRRQEAYYDSIHNPIFNPIVCKYKPVGAGLSCDEFMSYVSRDGIRFW